MKTNSFLSAIITLALCVGCREKISYTNPLTTEDGKVVRIADPFIYHHEGMYYLTGTTKNGELNMFEYFTSPDMVTWSAGGILFKPAEGHIGTAAFWAPEVKYYKGKFYLTYSCLDKQKGRLLSCLAVSETPEGPFKELYTPWFDLGHSAIDCHIFVDDDAAKTPYLYYSKNGNQDGYSFGTNYVVELTQDLSQFVGEPRLAIEPDQEWEKVNWAKNRCNEGATVIKHDGIYYMTYSGNDTGYNHYGVGVATAPHPLGPWTKYEHNPIRTTNLEIGVSSPGHNSIVASPDGKQLYIVYHRHADAHGPRPSYDRVLCIDKLYFEDGILKTTGPTSTPQTL